MKNIIRNLVVLCLMLMLIACGDSDSKNKSDSQKVYDYRDEHNQDFFSHYVLVKLRRTLLSENFHTPMGSSHCWLYAAV